MKRQEASRGNTRYQRQMELQFLIGHPGMVSLQRCCLSKGLKGVREQAKWVSGERAFQAKRAAHEMPDTSEKA